ncbi:MAG TPA: BamA/TamA family outer membrane protein [Flavisolibacter sp.]
MMKPICTILSILFLQSLALAQGGAPIDSIRQRIFLIGDAGELKDGRHPVIEWLKKNVDWNDKSNTAVFLGDNIYEYGLPSEGEDSYKYAKQVIDYQMSLVKGKKSKAYFVMGNHDWKNGKIGGWEQAVNQVDYINGQLQNNIEAYPRGGCPGPDIIELDTLVALSLIDTQWFLHTHDKPGPGSNCASKTIDEFSTELSEAMQLHPNQLMVVVTHHPLHTHGVHGGATYKLRHHLFPLTELNKNLYIPLPVLGSVYPIARGIFGNIQDVNHPLYRGMARTIDEVVRKHPNPIVVSGHDHSLQLVLHDSLYQIVSGSGAKTTDISAKKHNEDLLFGRGAYGCSVIEVTKSGKVSTRFFDVGSPDYATPLYARELFTIQRTLPKASVDSLRTLPDSITVLANAKLAGSGLSRFMVGNNYRREWTEPVTVPVLDLGQEQGGLRPLRAGGGKQTKSLRLEDASGKEWALRSIEKFPEAAIPPDLRQTFAKDVVEQGISASYPYASLSVEPLAKAAGLPAIRRKLVYVPDDPRLDRFRVDFSNRLAVLEEREPINIKKTDGTDEVVLKLAKDNDDHIDQRSVLKARLLDNFIMDFDRHEDQWRWSTRDTGKGKLYFAIPRDHDQAFFVNQGLIPRFAAKPWFVPEIQGFRAEAKNIKTFNKPARNFDRFFLNEMGQQQWEAHVDTFLNAMTDDVIETALRLQPREVQQFDMNKIISTLKRRKAFFREDMMKYYRFLSEEVSITGSNQKEQFTITKNDDGTVHVISHKIEKDSTVSSKIYERLFDPAVTEEIRIYGLGDEDRYIVEGGRSPIKIRIIGGPGNDRFINNGNAGKVIVYDATYEENTITGNKKGIRDRISNDPQVNRYNRFDYKYDFVNPGTSIAYNVDDGLFLGVQLEVVKQGFRKEPYKMRQYLSATRAFNTGALRFKYEGEWIKAIGNKDLLARADIRAPVNVTNFFGLGNETVFDKTKPGQERYYRARYDFIDVSLLMRRQLQSWMRVNLGGGFQAFRVENEGNANKFVSQTAINGLDPVDLYEQKMYAGAHFKLDINSKNNKAIPTRGFVMDFNLRPMAGLNKQSSNLLRADVDMRIFASIFSLPRLVLASRFGGGRIYGDFEFPQAYYLSGTENLRGYRRDRFGGRSSLYNNTELRFKVAEFSTYLFPGAFGILVFNDVGRVWMNGENSSDWKVGNGAGIWLAPIKRFVIAAHVVRSKEQKPTPYVSFGFQF